MSFNQKLKNICLEKNNRLCIGLDIDNEKLSNNSLDFMQEFIKDIISATIDLCPVYKINFAFYERYGSKGYEILEKISSFIDNDAITIADAKRGDIGNTSKMYAKAFFKNLNFDAVTVAPYMGSDSVTPFLAYGNKWVILLALTSNIGSLDFQNTKNEDGKQLFEQVLETSQTWGTDKNMMYVVGANRSEQLSEVREIIPNHFLLVPGVGAQGGSIEEVAKYGMNDECGLLVNSSRGIIYASTEVDFAEKAREEAQKLQFKMDILLSEKGI